MFYNYDVNISTRICHMLLIPECHRHTHTRRQTHDDGIYRVKIYTAVSCCRLYATGSLWFHRVSLKSASCRSAVNPTKVQW